MSRLGLSIVIPVFNEEENLHLLVDEIRSALQGYRESFEILFVDDGSTDNSLRTLRDLAARDAGIRLLQLPRNCGQSAAFNAGFQAARAPLIATLDADLQNDPADLPRLLSELHDCDVVCGVRTDRQDSWIRLMSSRIANFVRNRLTQESIADVGCSLRVYRTEFLLQVPMFHGMHRFLPTLLRKSGARLKEIPVGHRIRRHGQSKYGIHNRLWRGIVDLMVVRWMLTRWIDRQLVQEIPSRRASGQDGPME
jgi:glycosyltransferase involved in cell wall biosynthesis